VNELVKKINELVEDFFDKKTRNASISEDLDDKIKDIVFNTKENIEEILDDASREIDFEIEEESRPVYSYDQEYIDKANFIMNCQL